MQYRTKEESLTLDYVLAKLEAKKNPDKALAEYADHKVTYSVADKRKAAAVLERLRNLPERNVVVSIVPTTHVIEEV